MKVCTDACLFGAFVASQIMERQLKADNILDIGTGTGLLSLMVAQKVKGKIDAIEIDEAAYHQAKNNFERSPWSSRLKIVHSDAFLFHSEIKYDCIISNPPFFEGDLKSGNIKKNAAKHDTTLTLDQLLIIIESNLSPHGFFTVLLPYQRINYFIEIANAAQFFLNEQILIQHTGTHPFFRCILNFSKVKANFTSLELAVKDESGNYSRKFSELLRDYYLYL